MLNRHVRLAKVLGENGWSEEPVLYNAMAKTWALPDASTSELAEKLMLEGQEDTALSTRLKAQPENLNIMVVPSWGCNLRCNHCFVLHQLQVPASKEERSIDPDDVILFLNKYLDTHKVPTASVSLVGGEPMVRHHETERIITLIKSVCSSRGVKTAITMTTNLTTWPDNAHDLAESLAAINVSVDGDEEHHNQQRHLLKNRDGNPYLLTMNNLKLLTSRHAEKVYVQSALSEEFWQDKGRVRAFVVSLLEHGVLADNIFLGVKTPTKYSKEDESYLRYLRDPAIKTRPCCAFRYMEQFTLGPDGIYASYHDTAGSRLGSYDDSMDQLAAAYDTYISDNMPVLLDPICRSCPVLAFCWGGCNAENAYFKNNPSAHCNKPRLIEKVDSAESHGDLRILKTGHMKIMGDPRSAPKLIPT